MHQVIRMLNSVGTQLLNHYLEFITFNAYILSFRYVVNSTVDKAIF